MRPLVVVSPLVVALAVVGLARPAAADDAYLGRLAAQIRARLDAIAAAKAPKLVPPTPIAVTWKAARIGSVELGGPLVAFAAAELDGDPKSGELYAVTPRHVIAFGYRAGRVEELDRIAFAGPPAVPAPRDVVGTAVVENGELVVAASPWENDLRISWNNKKLVGKPGAGGFLVCPGERAQLATGRNHFKTNLYNVRCRNDLVDAQGQPLQVRAELAITNKLTVTVKRCSAGTCVDTGSFDYTKVGIAYEIADVDRDGTPELIISAANAPGQPDNVKVTSLNGTDLFKRAFNGGVGGVALVDGDDADTIAEVIAAVRLAGATRVDLWRLN